MAFPRKLFVLLLIFLTGCANAPVKQASTATPQKSLHFENTTVSLTFDDGAADNYLARSILAQNDIQATFYIVSGFTGMEGYMTKEQLRGLYEDGNEIGGHTLNHVNLAETENEKLEMEICQDRTNLLNYGFNVTSFAFPYGHYNEEAKQTVIDCGYGNARGVSGGPDTIPPADKYALKAMPYIVNDTSVTKMIRYIIGVEDEGGGWAIFVFHRVCEDCSQYAIDLDTFSKFAARLADQKQNGLVIKTIGEVLNGK
ncbi:MAG: polysaccharide deacetylase family protein [Chloroflexi bacterium]|nr:polysaccharide deacetylase family protein [Chloroflexota bacterium]